ncbi:uncharacterized protein LOC131850454 [Achroia grisella]|uniref:uncharacterized protein LOC131850454 n=1 Tax=Achroia grisella TaxID=688607 RepID=UPI0027D254AD|nr:uncharacterized protein LOC131850454 [Achroia grisella]XP_059056658.1 uncharacterized protein LOC131850454 [Achroia grisella]
MDVSFDNVMEGMRQYFMGVPKQAQAEGSGQSVWPAGTPMLEEGAPAQSGAPAHSSRPPSAAAAPPSTPSQMAIAIPPRPPSEPLPHIIHKATVMREAAEKRREMPEVEDEEEPIATLSPPSHFIRKPQCTLPSPAPAPAVHCQSPSRPPSAALPPPPVPETLEAPTQYRPPAHRVPTPTARPPDQFAPGRPPDPYTTSRPPEPYVRYPYESNLPDTGRSSHGPPVASPQPSMPPARHSPQTYARLSNSMPHHNATRLRETATHSPPAQRYTMPSAQPPPLHNDRVPPIHHPQTAPSQRLDVRTTPIYSPHLQHRREPSPYSRTSSHYDRHPSVPAQKYDPQQAYPGYRPISTTLQPLQNHRVEPHHAAQYKQAAVDTINQHYGSRASDRVPVPAQSHTHDTARLPSRVDYPTSSRNIENTHSRGAFSYPIPSTSTSRYASSASVPTAQNSSVQPRSSYRPAAAPKTNYEYPTSSPIQTSPARSTAKPGYPNQQARMTVSVTSLVNQMNQTKHKRDSPHTTNVQVNQMNPVKQKRESPLDLSVKTVKNSADSSTTQDDIIDSPSIENKTLSLQPRPALNNRQNIPSGSYVASHKVDFAPNFTQYRERSTHSFSAHTVQSTHQAVYNGAYDTRRPAPESYSVESPHPIYSERSKYNGPLNRTDHVPRIDLTRPSNDQRHLENRIRDDRHFIIEERKRPAGPIVNNIPEKIVRYETWTSNGRIERMSQSDREQHELMSRPVYSYSSHKQFEAYQNEHKRPIVNPYREQHSHVNHRYPNNSYPTDLPSRETTDYHPHYHDRNLSSNSRHHVIQKIPSHRDLYPNHLDLQNGVPADKRVLSILRNSLETKQSGGIEPTRQSRNTPDLIVIDDGDDTVIEITDLTKDNDNEPINKDLPKQIQSHISNLGSHIQMPKAVDSIQQDSDYSKLDNAEVKSKSPEYDVASRIRTKAELKVMPPSQESNVKPERILDVPTKHEKVKLLPKSQKQHLFNQIREDNLRLESVIKSENVTDIVLPEVKTEPMNIDEIEKDAEIPIKTETILENLESEVTQSGEPIEDLDWASTCDNFMEQLKTGCHKKKSQRKRFETAEFEQEDKTETPKKSQSAEATTSSEIQGEKDVAELVPSVVIKQEPVDEYEINETEPSSSIMQNCKEKVSQNKLDSENEQKEISKEKHDTLKQKENKNEKFKNDKKASKDNDKQTKSRKMKMKSEKNDSTTLISVTVKKEAKEKDTTKPIIKEELESTDDDEPLIKSKLLKDKEQNDRLKYQLLKDLSEKSAYVKLECCDVDVNKNNRKSIDSLSKDKEEKQHKGKLIKQTSRIKGKSLSIDNNKNLKQNSESTSDSDDDDDLSVASRLRIRKSIKSEESRAALGVKSPIKLSPLKKQDNGNASNNSTPIRKPGFGDGSDFHPGWEEELYRYKRSLRMPTRLIAIPRGRSGGPFLKGSGPLFSRGTTSLPDLDPAPLSPAPSSAPSAATDDLYSRRPDKLTLDSDLDSNSSCSAPQKLHYDSEASTSTVFSTSKAKNKGSSIVDVLIQKCGKKDDSKKKSKDKDERTPKVIPKNSNTSELLPTPSLGLVKNGNKNSLSAKKEKLMEDIYYLGAFRKETVTAFRNAFIKNTDGLIGATEEFAPVVLKSRTRTESRVLKQRATIKEVFGDERPASAPPSSCRENECIETHESTEEQVIEIKQEPKEPEAKTKFKSKKILKDKLKRRSSSIRDGLRSTKSLKRNDAKGRLLRLKKRNSLMKSLPNKRIKDISLKHKKQSGPNLDKDKSKEESSSLSINDGKRRLKRLFGRRKFSSGFDYIRKKKKIIRREDTDANTNRIRRPAVKPSPESVHDIHKEIKSWIINKSIGETHLHRAAKLGYTDCVAYCLEKMSTDPSAKDNAGFTPLHVASAKGHVRIARLLLQYGANVSAAAQGGIRPLHEASENCHVEVIRLLLSYGADPLLVTYAGQTPEELAEGQSARLIKLYVADVQGLAVEPWRFPHPADIIDLEEIGCDSLSSPPPASPPPPPDSTIEIQCTEAPLPPFYTLRTGTGQPCDGLWCLLQDVTNVLQIKSKDSLLKQIHCGSGSPKELLREIRTQEFLERAQCHQLLCAGEKVNVRASKVSLVRVTDKLRQLLKIETILVS